MAGDRTPPDPPELLGESAAMGAVRRVLERSARVDAPVLLEGETGTGKSLAARWIHCRSGRRGGEFLVVNCAGIPETLFESELFGHRRGAFTGAVEDRTGLFEAATGGTLFLDEVAELPLGQQVKLLTVLEDGRLRRIGETRERTVDARVLAATSRDLDEAVRVGTFRPDLFHRLALLRCTLPPLRRRDGDAVLLARAFLRDLGRKHLGRPACLTPAGEALLTGRDWPGNVRELAHALEAALILAGRTRLDRSHLEEVMDRPAPFPGGRGAADPGTAPRERTATRDGARYSFFGTDAEERESILEALRRFRGNRTHAARELGMSRSTLRGRMRKYGIE